MSSSAIFIAPDAYPQLPQVPALALKAALRSPKTVDAAKAALQAEEDSIRGAVLAVIAELQTAAESPARLYGLAHEIRGLAGNAGLPSAAKIAGLLCHYLDNVARSQSVPDREITGLHILALARSVKESAAPEVVKDAVLRGLSALVARKTTETGEVTSSFSAR